MTIQKTAKPYNKIFANQPRKAQYTPRTWKNFKQRLQRAHRKSSRAGASVLPPKPTKQEGSKKRGKSALCSSVDKNFISPRLTLKKSRIENAVGLSDTCKARILLNSPSLKKAGDLGSSTKKRGNTKKTSLITSIKKAMASSIATMNPFTPILSPHGQTLKKSGLENDGLLNTFEARVLFKSPIAPSKEKQKKFRHSQDEITSTVWSSCDDDDSMSTAPTANSVRSSPSLSPINHSSPLNSPAFENPSFSIESPQIAHENIMHFSSSPPPTSPSLSTNNSQPCGDAHAYTQLMEEERREKTQEKDPHYYTYLNKYNIPTDDLDEAEHLLEALVTLMKDCRGMPFWDVKDKRCHRKSRVVLFPQLSSKTSFSNWNKRIDGAGSEESDDENNPEEEKSKEPEPSSGESDASNHPEHSIISKIIDFQSNDKTSEAEDEEPIAALFWIESLLAAYPKTFDRVCTKNRYTQIKRFTPQKSFSFMAKYGMPFGKFLRMFSEDTRQWIGCALNSTKAELYEFAKNLPGITFGGKVYEKDKGNQPENIKWYTIDVEDAFVLDMERYIQDQIYSGIDKPSYGYKTCGDEDFGVYALIGSDHGSAVSQNLLRVLLKSSKERRSVGRAGYGCRTIPLISIHCKRDPPDILKETKQVVEDTITMLNTKRVIAVMNDAKEVRCSLVPKNSALSLDDGVLHIKHDNEDHDIHYEDLSPPPTHFWPVIKGSVEILCLCDLCAAFTFQGRDGHSHCKCISCDLKMSEWKQPDHRVGETLTLEKLEESWAARTTDDGQQDKLKYGVKMEHLWGICPTKYVPPLLHIALGLCNDVYDSLIHWCLYSNIDDFGEEERNGLIKNFDLNAELQREIEALPRLQELQTSANTELAELMNILPNLKKQLRAQNKSNVQSTRNLAAENQIRVDNGKSRLLALKANKKELAQSIASSKKNITSLSSQIKGNQDTVKKLALERKKGSSGICVDLENTLSANNIPYKMFFGGHMTYITCRSFMTKIEAITKDNESKIVGRLETRQVNQDSNLHEVLHPITIAACKSKLQKYEEVFELLDATFACLRIIDPTEDEFCLAQQLVDRVKAAWDDLELSVTPKAHILFEHVVPLSRKFGGLGDKVEEFIEEMHQQQKRQTQLVSRMSAGFEAQMRTTHRNLWMNNHPLVERELANVNTFKKRNVSESTSNANTEKADKMKDRNTDRFIKVLGEELYLSNYSI